MPIDKSIVFFDLIDKNCAWSRSKGSYVYFREEMEDVVGSIFDLMGRTSDPLLEEEVISERVDTIFEVCFVK